MYFLYLMVLFISAIYFAKRQVDVFSFAYVSSVVYFIPALLPAYEVEQGAYFVYASVFIFLVLAALIHHSTQTRAREGLEVEERRLRLFFRAALFLYVPAAVVWLLSHAMSPVESKSDVDGGLVHYTMSVLLGYVFISALFTRRWLATGVCAINYALILISGDRTQLLVAVIAALIFYGSARQWSIREVSTRYRAPVLAAGAVAILVGVFGKDIYGAYFDAVAGDRFSSAFERRATETIRDPSARFEPYHVQKILNYAIKHDDRVPPDYLASLPMQLLPMSGELGGDVHAQSRIIKQMYFQGWSEQSGVSSNFFAEGFLLFGYAGALLFAVVYSIGVFIFAKLVRSGNPAVRIASCFGAAFWVFYIHRSSILQIIGHEKRVFYSAVAIVIMMAFVKLLIEVGRKGRYG